MEIIQLALGRQSGLEVRQGRLPALAGGRGVWASSRQSSRCAPCGLRGLAAPAAGEMGDGEVVLLCMSTVSLPQDTSGRKPHKTGVWTPSAEQTQAPRRPWGAGWAAAGASSSRGILSSPGPASAVRSSAQRINRCAGYVRGRRGRVRSLCSQRSPGGP